MYVFVYGSLKYGFHNHSVMKSIGAEYVENATTLSKFNLVNLGPYPGMIYGDYRIVGEIYKVDQKGMDRLDRFEGHPNFYLRTDITHNMPEILIGPIFTYMYQYGRSSLYKYCPSRIDNVLREYKEWTKDLVN